MFQNLNPQDQATAFLEIGIMLLGAAIIGFVTAWVIRRASKSTGVDPDIEERHVADLKKNHAAIQGLKAKLEKADSDYSKLEKKYADTSQALKEKSKPALVFTTELEEVKKRLKQEKEANASLEKEVKQLKAEAKVSKPSQDHDPRVDQLQKEVGALTAQNKELLRRAESDEAEKEDNGTIDRLQKELTRLKTQNEEIRNKLSAQENNNESDEKVSDLERQLRQQKIELVQNTADLVTLQNKLSAAETNLANMKTEARENIPGDNDQLAKLEIKLDKRNEVIARLEGQIGKAESVAREAANTAAEMPQLKERIKTLEVENLSLKSRPAPPESANQKDLAKAEARIAELKSALVSFQEHNKNNEVQAPEKASGGDPAELEWLRKEKEDQEEEIAELEESILSLEKTNAQLRSRLRDKSGSQTEKQLQLLEKEHAKVRQELEKLRGGGKKPKGDAGSRPDFSHLGDIAAGESDTLVEIEGIGPEEANKLRWLGILTFRQLSQMNGADRAQIESILELEPGRVKSEKWTKQAKKLLKQAQN
jgi:predicted flap endonuclease-1-like 5' DNA nuclease